MKQDVKFWKAKADLLEKRVRLLEQHIDEADGDIDGLHYLADDEGMIDQSELDELSQRSEQRDIDRYVTRPSTERGEWHALRVALRDVIEREVGQDRPTVIQYRFRDGTRIWRYARRIAAAAHPAAETSRPGRDHGGERDHMNRT